MIQFFVDVSFVALLYFQLHIRLLETSQENISALLLGLEYLINISYVDDTEVFKVCSGLHLPYVLFTRHLF